MVNLEEGQGYGSAALAEPRASRRSNVGYKVLAAAIAASLVVVVLVAGNLQQPSSTELQQVSQKVMSLAQSKQKYDMAKKRVQTLHSEFEALKLQLSHQVQGLEKARSNLVQQVKQADPDTKIPILTDNMNDVGDEIYEPADTSFDEYEPAPAVKNLREAATAVASAGTSRDAADAAQHALSYTQQVASRVGDLADQAEKQAKRIVDAARLTQEAKEAMRSALEQSSQIVDYNTHAAQAVAQDSGFVTTAAQTISGYLHNIFHDSRAVHQAAIASVKHMNSDVHAADHAVDEIESDAQEAYEVLQHIQNADKAAHSFAKHARAASITAATAANGALKGERAAMVGGLKSIASARSAQAGAQAAMEYARAAQSAVHPWIYGKGPKEEESHDEEPQKAEPTEVGMPPASGGGSALMGAKELVDSVVVLMQQLTNALQSADDCDKVHEILTYYQSTMAQYHSDGQELAGKLTTADMNLVQQYAQTQVAMFANELEEVVQKTAEKCDVPVTAFIPDVSMTPKKDAGKPELHSADAEAKIASLKKQLAQVKTEREEKRAVEAPSKVPQPATMASHTEALDAAVEYEKQRVGELKAQIAELQQEKASLSSTL